MYVWSVLTKDSAGNLVPAKKPTRWMTNAPELAKLLAVRCDKSHRHQHLMGGRAAAAAFYSPKLLRTIIKGIARTLEASKCVRLLSNARSNLEGSASNMVANVNNIDEPNSANSVSHATIRTQEWEIDARRVR